MDRHFPSITCTTTKNDDEIVKDECILRLKDARSNDSGIYQVLAEGFETQASDNTNAVVYGKEIVPILWYQDRDNIYDVLSSLERLEKQWIDRKELWWLSGL